jgi:hypothetical protein
MVKISERSFSSVQISWTAGGGGMNALKVNRSASFVCSFCCKHWASYSRDARSLSLPLAVVPRVSAHFSHTPCYELSCLRAERQRNLAAPEDQQKTRSVVSRSNARGPSSVQPRDHVSRWTCRLGAKRGHIGSHSRGGGLVSVTCRRMFDDLLNFSVT